MRVLLDTQVVLWAGVAPERLGNAQRLIDEAEEALSDLAAESLPIANEHAAAVQS